MLKVNLNPFKMFNNNSTVKAPKDVSSPISHKFDNRDIVSFTGHYKSEKIPISSRYNQASGYMETKYSDEYYDIWYDEAPHVLSDMTKRLNLGPMKTEGDVDLATQMTEIIKNEKLPIVRNLKQEGKIEESIPIQREIIDALRAIGMNEQADKKEQSLVKDLEGLKKE